MDGLITHGCTVTTLLVPLLLIMLAVIHGSTARIKSPRFIDTETNITRFVGETAILPCLVKHLGTKEIIWKKTTQKFALTIGDFVYTLDSSYSIEHEKKKNERNVWNLVIKNVQKLHSGVYECQISTKEDLRRNITLNVLDAKPKKPKHLQGENNERNRIRPGSQNSQRKKPKAGHRKKHRKNRKKKKPLNPAIHISGPEFVDFGSEIILSCNATGIEYPPEDVDWFKDGLKIKGDSAEEIFVTKFRQSETKTLISKLIISHSELQDSGTYICRSSDLEITSHNLMVLNSESNQTKRGTDSDTKNVGSILPNTGKRTTDNGNETIHRQNYILLFIVMLTSLCTVFKVH